MQNLFKFEKRMEKKLLPYIDELFYLGGILSPLVAMPQLHQIYATKSATGVSLETWVLYFISAICLLFYGIVHKQKPIIFMNITVLPVYILIIAGIILYK